MILDSSAVIAFLFREPDTERIEERLVTAGTVSIGVPTLAETAIVLAHRLKEDPRTKLGRFLQEFRVAQRPFTEEHGQVALEAWLRFGKGRHPAALNYGDCLTYATARLARQPLLCVGNDFARTDLELA